ncbi:MAG: family 43 glycosylhydrolase [Pseudarcicella sp.]|nr:family 43 glycosylhydrolase [Pseudarcicella sp.]
MTKSNFKFQLLALAMLFVGNMVFAQKNPAGKKNTNTKPYPYGNPVIHHMYTADASPHVMPDGKVWMVTSVDDENGGGYSTMHSYHTFSSSDMKSWTDHGEVFNLKDALQGNPEPKDEDWALWAPDMTYRNGKYYLYYPIRIAVPDSVTKATGKKGYSYTAVAVSDHPSKKFKVINPRIEKTTGIDPAVFVDDDGQPYLYWGAHMGAKLKSNMYELEDKLVKLDVNTDRFMEAIWMNKRDNKYYLSYHTLYDWKGKVINNNPEDPADRRKSELAYSVGDSPLGPFKYVGTFNYELGVNVNNGPRLDEVKKYVPWRYTQSNHGGIVDFHGQEYLFYHTSALSSWRQDEFKGPGTWTQRSVCIDKIMYNADGTMIPVQQTIEGVEPVKVNQPYNIVLTNKLKKVTSTNRILSFKKIDLGTSYYYFGLKASNVKKPLKAEIRLDKPDGKLIGTVWVDKSGVSETTLREARGKHDVFVTFTENCDLNKMEFFAGSSK